ncbi:MAG TPA: DUF1272 domain-containing protein [Thermoanaerobaculia bacterium]|nr:DUF1272 domain-containing protein [Thermoanaerobaculia bacterium]
MALEMRPSCETCSIALTVESEAFICSYECTYCSPCAHRHERICPNCAGELVRRPRRQVALGSGL